MEGKQHEHSSCVTCPRRALTEWSELDPADLQIVDRHKRDRILQPGQVLYHQGDPCEGIYCIKDGLVGERRVDADGHSTLVRLCHPGTTVGYQELLSKSAYHNSAESLQESHVCFIGKSVVRQLLQGSPKLGERFLHRSLGDALDLQNALVVARTTKVKTRLLHVLMVFYERSGRYEPTSGHVFEIPIARQDLAALVGTAPATISRTIRKLEQDNIVHFQGNMATIPDLDVVFQQLC
jgi:CRP-like cAMP-binding protein